MTLADAIPGCDRVVVALAALLHDADDHKLFHTENNANARTFMQSQQVESDTIEFVCEVINGVSFSKNKGIHPGSIEGKIVQDADRLDALGAIGIARTFAFGGKNVQIMLLESEGVKFIDGRVDMEKYQWRPEF